MYHVVYKRIDLPNNLESLKIKYIGIDTLSKFQKISYDTFIQVWIMILLSFKLELKNWDKESVLRCAVNSEEELT